MPIAEGIARYKRKTLFIKLIKQLREIQDTVHLNQAAAQATVDFTLRKIKTLLDGLGVYSDLHHQYEAYAMALDKTQKELKFMVDLIREHQILRDRFERRGLDPEILDAIDQLIIHVGANK